MAIEIMQELGLPEDPKQIKIPGTGLSIYTGGNEKTPTGKSNSFSESGLTPQQVVDFAKRYKLPTTSNRAFQQAAMNLLLSSDIGKKHIAEMENVFGRTKSGNFVDDMLGARTKYLLQGLDYNNYMENVPNIYSHAIERDKDKGFVNSTDWAFDFGKDQKAFQDYENYMDTWNKSKAAEDSARMGLAPAKAVALNAMQARKKLTENTEAQKNYFKKYGVFPQKQYTSPEGTTDKEKLLSDFLNFRYGKGYKVD